MSSGLPALESVRLFDGPSARWLGRLPLMLAVVPPVLVVFGILNSGTPIPFEDHWDMVPLLERHAAGTLTFGDLWAQQNEHRYVIPWIAMLALARATRWNIVAELLLNVAFSFVAVALLAILVHRACRDRAPALMPWLVLGASLMTFSFVKWENWLRSMSQPAFLSTVAAVVTVFVLARRGPTLAGAILATLGAVAGVLCFANGLVLLAVVPAGFALDPRAPLSRRLRLVAATALLGGVIAALYLVGFAHPTKHPSPWVFLGNPTGFAGYVLVYLGAPLGWPAAAWSLAWGAVGVVALAVSSVWLWRHVPSTRIHLLPWGLLALYVVGSAVMVAIGRLGAGIPQALSSRYTTISTFFWISVFVVGALATAEVLRSPRVSARGRVGTVAAACVALVAASASYASVWVHTNPWVESTERVNVWALECLQFYRQAPNACLGLMHLDARVVRQRAEQLDRLGIGPFADRPNVPSLDSYTLVEPGEPAGAITASWQRPITVQFAGGSQDVYRSADLGLAGWAIDPATQRAPQAVLVAADGVVLGEVRTIAADAPSGEAHPGWAFRFSVFRLPPGARTLEAYAVLEGRRIARLQGARVLPARPGA